LRYRADYVAAEGGLTQGVHAVAVGYEQLGSDHGVGFKTPLATLHAFNGWADLFLTTPGAGLRDWYVRASTRLPGALNLTLAEHDYHADAGGAHYGTEFNAMLTRAFGPRVTAAVKYAAFSPHLPAFPHVRKGWLQLEYAF
jgi:hypothetical protein